MTIMERELKTLGQVAEILDVPEHRLIHLCESGVIEPVQDARGRGTVRRFDEANVLSFALCLELQRWNVQVDLLKRIVRLLSQVEKHLKLRGDRRDLIAAIAGEQDGLMANFFLPHTVVFQNATGNVLSAKLDEEGLPHRLDSQRVWPEGELSSLRVNLQALARHLQP